MAARHYRRSALHNNPELHKNPSGLHKRLIKRRLGADFWIEWGILDSLIIRAKTHNTPQMPPVFKKIFLDSLFHKDQDAVASLLEPGVRQARFGSFLLANEKRRTFS